MARPRPLISDSGGAFISEDFEAVCDRLEIDHQTDCEYPRRKLYESDGDPL